MFQGPEKRTSPLLKFMPVALAVFGILVAGAIYLSQHSQPPLEALEGVLHEEDVDFEWYREYLELKDPKIQMGLNYAGNRIVMFSGVFSNQGERTIDVIELKVVFFNYDEVLLETRRTPLRPGPYTPPIPQLSERAFSFYVEKIPEGWKSSHAEMSISGFRFAGASNSD
jgi:hypothetical protein